MEEKKLTRGILEIINELLTTLVYKYPPTLIERRAAIFVRTLIQHTNGFERAPTSRELAELILLYTIIPKDDDLEEPIGIPKFTKASNWFTHQTPELSKQQIDNRTPDSGTSPWNTFNIPETTSEVNAIGLNEKENPWKPSNTGKLISPSETPNTESQTPKGENIEDLLDKVSHRDKPLKDLYEGISNLRFGPDREKNPFSKLLREWISILLTFPTWESINDTYYYNFLNRKEPAKRKVIFGQTITTPPSNLLSGKQPRYQTRYQTRSNNSPEESPDDEDDDDDNDDNNNSPPNRQPNRPLNQSPPFSPPNQNIDGGGNNPSDGEQNNLMAQTLTALAQALGNLQPVSA